MSTNETIVDRVVARLQAQPLGDLITEEDLHDIVKEAIPRTFFKDRYIKEGSGFHERTVTKPPLIVEILTGLVRPVVEESVKQWLIEHADETVAHWKRILDKGLVQHVQAVLNDQATADVRAAVMNLVMRLNEERAKTGLPPVMV